MRYGFVKDHLPPYRYADCAEFFKVFVDFVSRFTQLEAGVSQALLGFLSYAPSLLRSQLLHFFIFIHCCYLANCWINSFASFELMGNRNLATHFYVTTN
jgi:hypothetical protein